MRLNYDCGGAFEILKHGTAFEQQRCHWLCSVTANTFYKTSQSIVKHAASKKLLGLFENTSQPTMLIVGERGSFNSRPKGRNVLIESIPKSGHFMIQENYKETADCIIRFLRKHKL
jgi:pimeloyl-ACP methyl ester carboxylesterase